MFGWCRRILVPTECVWLRGSHKSKNGNTLVNIRKCMPKAWINLHTTVDSLGLSCVPIQYPNNSHRSRRNVLPISWNRNPNQIPVRQRINLKFVQIFMFLLSRLIFHKVLKFPIYWVDRRVIRTLFAVSLLCLFSAPCEVLNEFLFEFPITIR